MIENRLVKLIPIVLIDNDGNEVKRFSNALVAASGNWNDAFKIACHARMKIIEDDGSRWCWGTIDKERIQRLIDIEEELADEKALLGSIFGFPYQRNTFKTLPDDITDLLDFRKVWDENRTNKKRIDSVKKTYYKPIQMLDNETGEILGEYDGIKDCERKTGFRRGDISLILSGKRRLKSLHGKTFQYKYKKDRLKSERELKKYKNNHRKTRSGGARPIKQIDARTGDIVASFPSTAEASRQTGIRDYNIHFCLKGKLREIDGFKFDYA